MERRTHEELDEELCGHARELGDGVAVVEMTCTARMRADARGLVHGGFVFGLADHAAMLAVNHPNVVLGSASLRFERPVVVGDRLRARAVLAGREGKKLRVEVEVQRDAEVVLRGDLVCFTPDHHVLEGAGRERTEGVR